MQLTAVHDVAGMILLPALAWTLLSVVLLWHTPLLLVLTVLHLMIVDLPCYTLLYTTDIHTSVSRSVAAVRHIRVLQMRGSSKLGDHRKCRNICTYMYTVAVFVVYI